MKRYHKAFTLAEMLVALGVIAVLCALILPMIYHVMPNKNIIMAKRAFYAVQMATSDLINDINCYPDKTKDPDESRRRVGFLDGYGYKNCSKWGGSENLDSLTSEDKVKKFETLFFDKFNVETTQKGEVITDDGIRWFYDTSQFSDTDAEKSYFAIHIDVNGSDKPNCGQQHIGDVAVCESDKENYDQFTLRIYADGKVEIADEWAADAVDITNSITR